MRPVLLITTCMLALVAGAGATRRVSHIDTSVRVLRFVDRTRTAHFRNGETRPRTLVTYVRTPPSGRGPFPLVVFGHGYAVTPGLYARLLGAWARAGYVVAAPLFPVENAHAPGGPDESDLLNQPADVSFVISRLLAANDDVRSPLHGLIDPTRIVSAGQSDGGETALAVAYDSRFLDRRVRAAVILSGARMPGGRLVPGPPLLAVQGTLDRINPPRFTNEFFRAASRPKFLLSLYGAGHLPPYTTNSTQLGLVERVTIAFLDHYLAHAPLRRLLLAGTAPGLARLTADP